MPDRQEPDSKAARTRRRILESAAHELARHGYGGTSLRKVAAGAQLQQGSLYFHFGSKDELVAATLAEGIDLAMRRIADAIGDLPAEADGRARLEAAVRAHVAALNTSHDLSAAVVRMVHTLPAGLRAAQQVHERRYGRLWRDLLAGAQRDGHVAADVDLDQLTGFVIWGLNSFLGVDDVGLSSARLDQVTAAVVGLIAPR